MMGMPMTFRVPTEGHGSPSSALAWDPVPTTLIKTMIQQPNDTLT